jgi:hypothetical protein
MTKKAGSESRDAQITLTVTVVMVDVCGCCCCSCRNEGARIIAHWNTSFTAWFPLLLPLKKISMDGDAFHISFLQRLYFQPIRASCDKMHKGKDV